MTALATGRCRGGCAGLGLIECLLALLLLSVAMIALLSAQLTGKRAAYEALQRGVAVGLAQDMLGRIGVNPGQAGSYAIRNLGDSAAPLPHPARDCSRAECNPAELAAYDLWQWEVALLGNSEEGDGGAVLSAPRACITSAGQRVTVAVSWRGFTPVADGSPGDCGADVTGLYDAAGAPGNNLLRRTVVLSDFLGSGA